MINHHGTERIDEMDIINNDSDKHPKKAKSAESIFLTFNDIWKQERQIQLLSK